MKYVVALIIAVLVPTGVSAKGACEPDVEKFCNGLERGAKLTACLREHEAELEPGCKAMLQTGKNSKEQQ
jgi:hypothetical protein